MGSFAIFTQKTQNTRHESFMDASSQCVNGFTTTPTSIVPYRVLSPHAEIPLPLFKDSEIALLLDHYQNHVATLLQPVPHAKNPWRTTYVPFALEGRPDLLLSQHTAQNSTASTAIFYGILSSAAFHLRNATNGTERFHRLGLRYRTKALHALNKALMDINDSQLYTVQLTAILSLVTIDVSPSLRPIFHPLVPTWARFNHSCITFKRPQGSRSLL